jgi:hypothetical protein
LRPSPRPETQLRLRESCTAYPTVDRLDPWIGSHERLRPITLKTYVITVVMSCAEAARPDHAEHLPANHRLITVYRGPTARGRRDTARAVCLRNLRNSRYQIAADAVETPDCPDCYEIPDCPPLPRPSTRSRRTYYRVAVASIGDNTTEYRRLSARIQAELPPESAVCVVDCALLRHARLPAVREARCSRGRP